MLRHSTSQGRILHHTYHIISHPPHTPSQHTHPPHTSSPHRHRHAGWGWTQDQSCADRSRVRGQDKVGESTTVSISQTSGGRGVEQIFDADVKTEIRWEIFRSIIVLFYIFILLFLLFFLYFYCCGFFSGSFSFSLSLAFAFFNSCHGGAGLRVHS
jgi:hypothetical protein